MIKNKINQPLQTTLMTAGEIARYLRISGASVYRLVKEKKIPVSKVGRQLRFRKDAIDRWLAHQEKHVSDTHK